MTSVDWYQATTDSDSDSPYSALSEGDTLLIDTPLVEEDVFGGHGAITADIFVGHWGAEVPRQPLAEVVEPIVEWSGQLVEIRSDGELVFALTDPTYRHGDAEAALSPADFDAADLRYLVPGAAISWAVVRRRNVATGRVRRETRVQVHRPVKPSDSDIAASQRWVRDIQAMRERARNSAP